MTHAQLLVASALLLAAPFTQAQGDVAQGQALFTAQCGFCHSPEAGKNLMGPSLHGVFNRASAQALKAAFDELYPERFHIDIIDLISDHLPCLSTLHSIPDEIVFVLA